MVAESKDVLKRQNDAGEKGMSEGHRSQMKVPSDQSWGDLSNKINSIISNYNPKYKIYIYIDLSK